MTKKITIIQGHPDLKRNHLLHALADSYAEGAKAAGSDVELIEIANLDFPLLRSKEDFDEGEPPPSIYNVQEILKKSDHLVFFYPLWLGDMPALLKGFLEQTFRPKLLSGDKKTGSQIKLFKGKSARIVVTMGMPAFFYRWFYRAHTLKNFKRNILKFCGFDPVKVSLFGAVDSVTNETRQRWLAKVHRLGFQGK